MKSIQLIQISPEDLAKTISYELRKEIESLKEEMTADSNEVEFMTRKETANCLNISLVCLHDWVRNDFLKPYKMGSRTYFKKSEIFAALSDSNK